MIEALELLGVRMSPDGKRLRLRVKDQAGRTVSLSLPSGWLNAMLAALPRAPAPGAVHSLDSWTMDRTGGGQDVVLTLRTPEGQAISFAMKSWQVEGMATIATYGRSAPAQGSTLH